MRTKCALAAAVGVVIVSRGIGGHVAYAAAPRTPAQATANAANDLAQGIASGRITLTPTASATPTLTATPTVTATAVLVATATVTSTPLPVLPVPAHTDLPLAGYVRPSSLAPEIAGEWLELALANNRWDVIIGSGIGDGTCHDLLGNWVNVFVFQDKFGNTQVATRDYFSEDSPCLITQAIWHSDTPCAIDTDTGLCEALADPVNSIPDAGQDSQPPATAPPTATPSPPVIPTPIIIIQTRVVREFVEAPTPEPFPTPAPIPTPSPWPTITPVPTSTVVPTSTSTVTPTVTPTATSTRVPPTASPTSHVLETARPVAVEPSKPWPLFALIGGIASGTGSLSVMLIDWFHRSLPTSDSPVAPLLLAISTSGRQMPGQPGIKPTRRTWTRPYRVMTSRRPRSFLMAHVGSERWTPDIADRSQLDQLKNVAKLQNYKWWTSFDNYLERVYPVE